MTWVNVGCNTVCPDLPRWRLWLTCLRLSIWSTGRSCVQGCSELQPHAGPYPFGSVPCDSEGQRFTQCSSIWSHSATFCKCTSTAQRWAMSRHFAGTAGAPGRAWGSRMLFLTEMVVGPEHGLPRAVSRPQSARVQEAFGQRAQK